MMAFHENCRSLTSNISIHLKTKADPLLTLYYRRLKMKALLFLAVLFESRSKVLKHLTSAIVIEIQFRLNIDSSRRTEFLLWYG